jgi:Bacterial pullanase-associated domain
MFNTKHRVAKLGTLLAVASLGLTALTGLASAQAADTTTTFKIHLDKTLTDSAGVNAWVWGIDAASSGADSTPNFTNEDGYGSYAQLDVTQATAPVELGFKIRSQESWDNPITPDNQALPVTGAVNEIWCKVATGLCTTTAPTNTPLTVRVHVNKVLADIPAWNVYYFNNDHPGTADADTAQFTKSDDYGAISEFKVLQDVSHTNPPVNVGDHNKPFGLIVRVDEGWTKKASGNDDIIPTWNNGVAEVWCETVDVTALGCSSTKPAPMTHVTIHINQPLDATHNYVVWDNHVTNNTDVLSAPTFATEDRYGAISKYAFSDPSISSIRFYITNGRSADSSKITGASDMTIPVKSSVGEVWCDVVAAVPSCTDKLNETFHVNVHVNAGTDVTSTWNLFTWALGSHTDPNTTIPFVAEGASGSVASYDYTTDSLPEASVNGWLIRDRQEWTDLTIKPTGNDNQLWNLSSYNVEVWCDATGYAVDRTTDPLKPKLTHGISCSSVAPSTITVHYNKPMTDMSGWEIAAFGTGVGGDTRVQFTGHDAFGSTAVIHYNPSVTDTGAISFAIRKYQPFVAATDSTLQQNLDPWSCVDGMADCTGGFFRQTTGDRVVPSGANEVWTLTGSSQISDSNYAEDIAMMPSNDIKLTTKALGRGKVRVFATAGAGTTPTAIVIDVLNRKGVSVKPGISCVIGKNDVGTTLASSCDVKGLKKGVKYRLWAHALTYGVGSSAHSRRTGAIPVK